MTVRVAAPSLRRSQKPSSTYSGGVGQSFSVRAWLGCREYKGEGWGDRPPVPLPAKQLVFF